MEPVASATGPQGTLSGVLHVFVAFDWGEEVNLEHARQLVPAEVHALPRRRRTPVSIGYRPPPLRFPLASIALDLAEIGPSKATAEVMVFDFAALSVSLHIPLTLSAEAIRRLAGSLAEPVGLVQAARTVLEPLYQNLKPAIVGPLFSPLSEEYFVFQVPPVPALGRPVELLEFHAAWLAGLVRLEAGPLSAEEVTEALRRQISYSPADLFVADWAAAFLMDQDCDETLATIEFANLQLLEFRHIDDRLDDSVAAAYRLIHPLTRSWLPFWRSHARPLRLVGELKVEAVSVFERTGNVFKLVGDQYLARVYSLLSARFHLEEWEQSILRKLEVLEGIYQVLSSQTATYRTEILEMIIILLILFEIVMALWRH